VIDPHVAVGVEETQSRSAQGDPLLGQRLAKLSSALGGGQARQLADCLFADCEPPSDFAIRVSLSLELLDGSSPGASQAHPSLGIAAWLSQGGQPAILETLLVWTHRPGGATKRAGHFALIGPALLDQTDHRVGLGHAIPKCLMGQDDTRADHPAVSIPGSHQAAFVNDLCIWRVPDVWEKVVIDRGSHTWLLYRAFQKSGQFWVRARASCRG